MAVAPPFLVFFAFGLVVLGGDKSAPRATREECTVTASSITTPRRALGSDSPAAPQDGRPRFVSSLRTVPRRGDQVRQPDASEHPRPRHPKRVRKKHDDEGRAHHDSYPHEETEHC